MADERSMNYHEAIMADWIKPNFYTIQERTIGDGFQNSVGMGMVSIMMAGCGMRPTSSLRAFDTFNLCLREHSFLWVLRGNDVLSFNFLHKCNAF